MKGAYWLLERGVSETGAAREPRVKPRVERREGVFILLFG